jgi:hypothetical protein
VFVGAQALADVPCRTEFRLASRPAGGGGGGGGLAAPAE